MMEHETPTGQATGQTGEKIARIWLEKQGFWIHETNYRRKLGELDIIAEKFAVLHFIEVKTSKYFPETAFQPEIRIDRRKENKLKRLCELFIKDRKISDDQKWQIDVISVTLNEDGSVRGINHIESAVFEKQY